MCGASRCFFFSVDRCLLRSGCHRPNVRPFTPHVSLLTPKFTPRPRRSSFVVRRSSSHLLQTLSPTPRTCTPNQTKPNQTKPFERPRPRPPSSTSALVHAPLVRHLHRLPARAQLPQNLHLSSWCMDKNKRQSVQLTSHSKPEPKPITNHTHATVPPPPWPAPAARPPPAAPRWPASPAPTPQPAGPAPPRAARAGAATRRAPLRPPAAACRSRPAVCRFGKRGGMCGVDGCMDR